MKYYMPINNNPYLIEVHIADIHFGSVDPFKEYTILKEQFLNVIANIPFDVLSIDGDIFDKKLMANSTAIYYAMEFVRQCAMLCIQKQATMIIIAGTESHDAGQIQLFYSYKDDPNLDIRIVEHAAFEYVKGLKVLCIPEEYSKGEDYYHKFLDEYYDSVFMHGTVVGSVFGATKEDLNSSKYPVFSIDSFAGCRGPIISGHVHKAMCLNGYIYYCSNPVRYRFGEEEEKGFCIVSHDRVSGYHTFNFIPIKSFRYDTIDIKTLNYQDPDTVVKYLDNLLMNGIDNIRIDFSNLDEPIVQTVIEQYYANNPNVSIKRHPGKTSPRINTTQEIEDKYKDLDFLLDPSLDEYTKFVHFINHNMGKQYITVEKLKSLLSGGT
jgi:DNA repair exonuclease SbcCD nuclease subunit